MFAGWKHILIARASVVGGLVVSLWDITDQVAKADNVDLFAFVPPNLHGGAMVLAGVLIESARRNLRPVAC